MSPQNQLEEYKKCKVDVKVLKQKYNRLISRLQSQQATLHSEDNTSAKNIKKDAILHIKQDWNKTNDDIVKLLMNIMFEVGDGKRLLRTWRKKCAEYITDSIKNMSLNFNDESKQCRYPPHIISIAISVYISSKKNYNDIRHSGLISLPNPKTLQRMTEPFKVTAGFDC